MPNLFVVGAMKAATTSLHNYLAHHPDIFMTKKPWKEPCFFVTELNWNKGWDWYLGLFKEATTQKYLGESTTDYTKAPNYAGVPERIHAASPGAKIIYIVRDPIERAISQYWWEVEYSGEGRKMPQGIIENEWIINASNYALQIAPYIKLFGQENVLILTSEGLVANPRKTVLDIFSWLGVTTDIQLPDEFGIHNQSKASVNQIVGAGLLTKLKSTFVWGVLKKLLNRQMKEKLRKSFSRNISKDESNREEVIAALRPIMLPQVEALTKLTGKSYPEWQTLLGGGGNQNTKN